MQLEKHVPRISKLNNFIILIDFCKHSPELTIFKVLTCLYENPVALEY